MSLNLKPLFRLNQIVVMQFYKESILTQEAFLNVFEVSSLFDQSALLKTNQPVTSSSPVSSLMTSSAHSFVSSPPENTNSSFGYYKKTVENRYVNEKATP